MVGKILLSLILAGVATIAIYFLKFFLYSLSKILREERQEINFVRSLSKEDAQKEIKKRLTERYGFYHQEAFRLAIEVLEEGLNSKNVLEIEDYGIEITVKRKTVFLVKSTPQGPCAAKGPVYKSYYENLSNIYFLMHSLIEEKDLYS